MEREFVLKLQSYLDGELSANEARDVAAQVESNAEAASLVSELRMTRGFLKDNEMIVGCPESRGFFWSKIQNQIEPKQGGDARRGFSTSWSALLRRALGPLTGFAVAVILAIGVVEYYDLAPFSHYSGPTSEVENESEHMGSFSFRSRAENMFVVWIYDKNVDSDIEAESDITDDEERRGFNCSWATHRAGRRISTKA